MHQVVDWETQTRSAPFYISIASVARIFAVHTNALNRCLFDFLVLVHAFLETLIFVVSNEV